MNHWTKRYLELARDISLWSKDPSTKVGAICVGDKGQLLSQGYNGFPRGVRDLDKRYADRETKYRYVIHAEMNAIYNACLNGVSLQDSTLYIYGLPGCSECAKGIIQVGISKVIMQHPLSMISKWKDSFKLTAEMFKEAGIIYLRYDEDFNPIES